MDKNVVLSVRDLVVGFRRGSGLFYALQGMDFDLHEGETLGVVGESGSGKSVTALSILRLLGSGGRILSGSIRLRGEELTTVSEKRMQEIRGGDISMIFQEPMTALNPVFSVGFQLVETIRVHLGLTGREAEEYAVQMIDRVGIRNSRDVYRQFPHELSGGMRQRILIAIALACRPGVLLADEPTTALDVTVQKEIFDLLSELQHEFGTAILLITHDLGVIAEMADRGLVVYGGQIVEDADINTLFQRMTHPYTKALFSSIPRLDTEHVERIESIPGAVSPNYDILPGCRFANRCRFADERCKSSMPVLSPREDSSHRVRCLKF